MKKRKINKAGETIGLEIVKDLVEIRSGQGALPDYEYVKQQFKDGEGCNMAGTIQVHKVRKIY